MESNALSQLKTLLAAAPTLRAQLSNAERLQLSGLAEALRNELERPDEAVFRVTFNEVRLTLLRWASWVCGVVATAFGRLALTTSGMHTAWTLSRYSTRFAMGSFRGFG